MIKAFNKIQKIIEEDPTEKKNIGSFTSIHTNPVVSHYLLHYLNKNLVDKKGYKSLTLFEKEIDKFFKRKFDNQNGSTIVTSGSTESVLLAFHYAREKAREEKGITHPNILIAENAHYSLPRCARMLNIELVKIPVTDRGSIDINVVKEKINSNTILIVGVLVTTELGVIDNLVGLDEIATEHGTGLHVDAAIGGFIIPFLKTDLKYKFSQLKSMASMNISGHKFGLSLCGCGILMLRDKKITEKYTETIDYLSSGKKRMDNFMVTSSALGLFSMYANLTVYGEHGYEQFAKGYMQTKKQLIQKLTALGIQCNPGAEYSPHIFMYGEDIEELSIFLASKGWVQHVYKAKGFDHPGIRLVVKKDQERRLLKEFVDDVKEYQESKDKHEHNQHHQHHQQHHKVHQKIHVNPADTIIIYKGN
jgi:glutamate/tyrosine decarboxylase-like PLP-dependent enzyme